MSNVIAKSRQDHKVRKATNMNLSDVLRRI